MRLTDPARLALKQFALEHTIMQPAKRFGAHVVRELSDHGLVEICGAIRGHTGLSIPSYRLTPAGEQASTGEIGA